MLDQEETIRVVFVLPKLKVPPLERDQLSAPQPCANRNQEKREVVRADHLCRIEE
jgi:hypothetical protein